LAEKKYTVYVTEHNGTNVLQAFIYLSLYLSLFWQLVATWISEILT